MKPFLFIAAFLFTTVIISGCATSGGYPVVNSENELPSIQQKHSYKLSKLNVGMSLEDFRQLFPKAYVGGQYKRTTAYELADIQYYVTQDDICLLYTSPSPRDRTRSRMPSSA